MTVKLKKEERDDELSSDEDEEVEAESGDEVDEDGK